MLKLKVEHICFVSDNVYLEDSDEVFTSFSCIVICHK